MNWILSMMGFSWNVALIIAGAALLMASIVGKPALMTQPGGVAFEWVLPVARWIGLGMLLWGMHSVDVRVEVQSALTAHDAVLREAVAAQEVKDRAAADAAVAAAMKSADKRHVALTKLQRIIEDAADTNCVEPDAVRRAIDGLHLAGSGDSAP